MDRDVIARLRAAMANDVEDLAETLMDVRHDLPQAVKDMAKLMVDEWLERLAAEHRFQQVARGLSGLLDDLEQQDDRT